MADDEILDSEYDVGYGKPPKHTQFQPGQSGNPRGRPKKSKNVDTLLEKELDAIVTLQEGGKPIRITKREAIIKQFVNLAIKGNAKPLQMVLAHLDKTREPEPFVPSAEDDDEILRAFGQMGPAGSYVEETDDGDS
ncbi:MAG: hypothetical protein K0U74_04050 [Alphaproteobacteria bacterium]|nr:hypothetical protein [Alphaproteobacteria bacterium]